MPGHLLTSFALSEGKGMSLILEQESVHRIEVQHQKRTNTMGDCLTYISRIVERRDFKTSNLKTEC